MKYMKSFFSQSDDKQAKVYMIEDTNGEQIPMVLFKRGDKIVNAREFPGHSLLYAERAAENYCSGVLKFS